MIKLLLMKFVPRFVHHTTLLDVVCGLSIKFSSPKTDSFGTKSNRYLTPLCTNEGVKREKNNNNNNIVTFDLFEHKQSSEQATNYIDVGVWVYVS